MGENIAIEKIVNTFINDFGINRIDIQNSKIYSQLKIIEEFFQQQEENQKLYFQKLKDARKINISKVSDATNISRSSIYNSPNILQIYIESRILILTEKDISGFSSIKNNDDKMKILVKVNQGLQQEVVNSYESKLYIEKLQSEIESLLQKRESDIYEIHKFKQEINNLQSELKKSKRNEVIKIKRD